MQVTTAQLMVRQLQLELAERDKADETRIAQAKGKGKRADEATELELQAQCDQSRLAELA